MALQAGLPLDVWGSGFASQQAAVLMPKPLKWSESTVYVCSLRPSSMLIMMHSLLAQYEIVKAQQQSAQTMLDIATMRQERDDATV